MQYLREDRVGNRKTIPEPEYQADRLNRNSYRQIHAFGNVIVYKMI